MSGADLGLIVLRRLPPEMSHRLTLGGLQLLERTGLLKFLLPPSAKTPSPRNLMGLQFPNPVGLAAGLDKDATCIDGLARLGFGFMEVGTVTPQPSAGNSGRRLWRLRSQKALINRLGFPSLGLDFVRQKLQHRRWQGVLGVNIGRQPGHSAAESAADYCLCMEVLWPLCDYLVINLSSPNSPGLRQLQQKRRLQPLLAQVQAKAEQLQQQHGYTRPLLLKLSPDLSEQQRKEVAQVLAGFALAGVILTNTSASHPQSEPGGLSGPPLAAAARASLQHFHELLPAEMVRISCGGIDSAQEAEHRLQLGADLVQVFTGLVYEGVGLVRQSISRCG